MLLLGGQLVQVLLEHNVVPRHLPGLGLGPEVLVVVRVLGVKHGLVGLRLAEGLRKRYNKVKRGR